MCCIIGNGVLQGMSVVIGVCGQNFCTFYADGRRVVKDGSEPNGYRIVGDDRFQKVFKLNSRVLYGAAGWFDIEEELLDPVSSIQNIEQASVKIVKNAVVAYMRKHSYGEMTLGAGLARSFLVGGKEHDNSYVMYEIMWDYVRAKPHIVERRPPQNSFGLSMMLPIKEPQLAQRCVARASELIQKSKTLDEVDHNMSSLIYSISQLDETVGPSALQVSVQG